MQYGNQESNKNKTSGHQSLNRTMQYGNFFLCIVLFCGFSCLNRTMQYGNHHLLPLHHHLPLRLNRTMQYGNVPPNRLPTLCQTFKSYYVVWKLLHTAIKWRRALSLNRTMQYGNYASATFKHTCKIKFKSYYVVWKLILSIGDSVVSCSV